MFPDFGPLIRSLFIWSIVGLVSAAVGAVVILIWIVQHVRLAIT